MSGTVTRSNQELREKALVLKFLNEESRVRLTKYEKGHSEGVEVYIKNNLIY